MMLIYLVLQSWTLIKWLKWYILCLDPRRVEPPAQMVGFRCLGKI